MRIKQGYTSSLYKLHHSRPLGTFHSFTGVWCISLSHFPNCMLLVSLEIGGVILSEPGGPGLWSFLPGHHGQGLEEMEGPCVESAAAGRPGVDRL